MKCEKCGADVDPITQVCDVCGFPYMGERDSEQQTPPSDQSVKKIYFTRAPQETEQDWEADLSALETEGDQDDWTVTFDRTTETDAKPLESTPMHGDMEENVVEVLNDETAEDWEADFDKATAPPVPSSPPVSSPKAPRKKKVLTHSPLETEPEQADDNAELKRVLQTVFTSASDEPKSTKAPPLPPSKPMESAAPVAQSKPSAPPPLPTTPDSAHATRSTAPATTTDEDDWQLHSEAPAVAPPPPEPARSRPTASAKPNSVKPPRSAKKKTAHKPTQLPLSLPQSGRSREEETMEIFVVAAGFLRRSVAGVHRSRRCIVPDAAFYRPGNRRLRIDAIARSRTERPGLSVSHYRPITR